MTDFTYHTRMQAIADEDVRFTIEKDTSYDASWKKRGGVGAFMMLARKWDRLEAMCKRDGWDVLALARKEGIGGADGTLIAEIRDLRRYLLLVEADVVESLARASTQFEEMLAENFSNPVPVEDSNRHAERAPPAPHPDTLIVPEDWEPPPTERAGISILYTRSELVDLVGENRVGFATQSAPASWRLPEMVVGRHPVPESLRDYYLLFGTVQILDRRRIPEINTLTRYPTEVNHYDIVMMKQGERHLYIWHSAQHKYVMRRWMIPFWGK